MSAARGAAERGVTGIQSNADATSSQPIALLDPLVDRLCRRRQVARRIVIPVGVVDRPAVGRQDVDDHLRHLAPRLLVISFVCASTFLTAVISVRVSPLTGMSLPSSIVL